TLVSVAADRLEFRHHLLRAALYKAASSVSRRAAHQALADAIGNAQEIERRAWHLAAAAPGQDESAAAALEEAARAAKGRGGHAGAASALGRAATLGTQGAESARRLRAAAADTWLVGRVDHALQLLDAALDQVDDARLRARIQHLRGVIEMWQGSPEEAQTLLAAEAARIEDLDADRAARVVAETARARLVAGEFRAGPGTRVKAWQGRRWSRWRCRDACKGGPRYRPGIERRSGPGGATVRRISEPARVDRLVFGPLPAVPPRRARAALVRAVRHGAPSAHSDHR